MGVPVGQRNVPDTPANRQLKAAIEARNLALHTIKICNNKNIFLPEYESALTEDLIRTAKNIYIHIGNANDIVVRKPEHWESRSRLQVRAWRECRDMLRMIELARALFHLRGKKASYWSALVIDVRNLIRAWHEADQARYGGL